VGRQATQARPGPPLARETVRCSSTRLAVRRSTPARRRSSATRPQVTPQPPVCGPGGKRLWFGLVDGGKDMALDMRGAARVMNRLSDRLPARRPDIRRHGQYLLAEAGRLGYAAAAVAA